MKILLVVTENKECPFLTSPNKCEIFLFKNKYFRAVYHAYAYWNLFFLKSIIYITILNHRYNSQQDAWAICAQIMNCLYKYTVFRAKKSEIRPIRPIPNVHAHTIGIVFASSKPIEIEYCFDDVWIKDPPPGFLYSDCTRNRTVLKYMSYEVNFWQKGLVYQEGISLIILW